MKDLNSQLRDLLSTYNHESKKLREDFERRELEYQNKISELNKALILQEKKMVDKVIESIEMKHQSYNQKNVEFDFMAKMDEEYDKLKSKRKEISEKACLASFDKMAPSTRKICCPPIVSTRTPSLEKRVYFVSSLPSKKIF